MSSDINLGTSLGINFGMSLDMKMLYAPWREDYTTDTAQGPLGQQGVSEDKCVFCAHVSQKNDDENFILKRFESCYLVLNRYPYNAGHLLVIPYKHTGKLQDLTDQTRTELMSVINQATIIIEQELKTDGINVGLNLGKAAGAGMPSHVHFHVLPRWLGDTNFLPSLAGVKTVSSDLVTIFKRFKAKF